MINMHCAGLLILNICTIRQDWLTRTWWVQFYIQINPYLCISVGPGVPEAQNNRDFVTGKMSNEIHEIIRVLQLTTYDEEEWDADDITVMKKALVSI